MPKKLKLILLLSFFSSICAPICGKDIKVLVLIIASDQYPVYIGEQERWRSYMHYDPEHVEAYFLKDNPDLAHDVEIQDDIIWCKTRPGWSEQGYAGILNKTLIALEALEPRFREFDYILRTNLSSFYIFPRFLQFLETLPRTKCYSGSIVPHCGIASGCGFILSPDVAELLVTNKGKMLNNASQPDDVIMGFFIMKQLKIKPIPHARADVTTMATWNDFKESIPADTFHFRLKNDDTSLRSSDELNIYSQLISKFYDPFILKEENE